MNRAAVLRVRIDGGETVDVAVRLVFGSDGALLRVVFPNLPTHDPRERAARRLVARLDGELARPGAPGVLAVQLEAELLADLAGQLLDIEAAHDAGRARRGAA